MCTPRLFLYNWLLIAHSQRINYPGYTPALEHTTCRHRLLIDCSFRILSGTVLVYLCWWSCAVMLQPYAHCVSFVLLRPIGLVSKLKREEDKKVKTEPESIVRVQLVRLPLQTSCLGPVHADTRQSGNHYLSPRSSVSLVSVASAPFPS